MKNIQPLASLVCGAIDERQILPSESRTDFLYELELAVSEIATNIVVHAYRDYPYTGRIQGRTTATQTGVSVDLIDSGLPYEPPSHTVEFSSSDPPVSGYGLVIARGLLEVCQYKRLANGRNHWHLEKSFKPHAANPAQTGT